MESDCRRRPRGNSLSCGMYIIMIVPKTSNLLRSDLIITTVPLFTWFQASGQLLDTDFQPTVTATCKDGYMTIRTNLNQSFLGAVHAKEYRTPGCMVLGNGTSSVTLGINLHATRGAPDYCGVQVNNVSYSFEMNPRSLRNQRRLLFSTDEFFFFLENGRGEVSVDRRPDPQDAGTRGWQVLRDHLRQSRLQKRQVSSSEPVLLSFRFLQLPLHFLGTWIQLPLCRKLHHVFSRHCRLLSCWTRTGTVENAGFGKERLRRMRDNLRRLFTDSFKANLHHG